MNKVSGKKSDFSLIREERSRIVLGYGLTAVEGQEDLYEWYEVYLNKNETPQLTLQIVKDAINGDINAQTTAAITGGFDYTVLHGEQAGTEVRVWLSKENQSDFHAMHQNASGLTFPVRYKVGEMEDGTPVYEEFADADEMHAICVSTANHVLGCQQAGWARKDAVDWSEYEEALTPPEPEPEPEPEEESEPEPEEQEEEVEQ